MTIRRVPKTISDVLLENAPVPCLLRRSGGRVRGARFRDTGWAWYIRHGEGSFVYESRAQAAQAVYKERANKLMSEHMKDFAEGVLSDAE